MKTPVEQATFAKVVGNLNKQVKAMSKRTMPGLIRAAALIRRAMDIEQPLIPVDTGNLRQSWTVIPVQSATTKPAVIIGFTANYAFTVHERVGARFKRPGAGAKFFESALNNHEKDVLAAIRDSARVE